MRLTLYYLLDRFGISVFACRDPRSYLPYLFNAAQNV